MRPFARSCGGLREIHGTNVRIVARFSHVNRVFFIISIQSGTGRARLRKRIPIVVARPLGSRGEERGAHLISPKGIFGRMILWPISPLVRRCRRILSGSLLRAARFSATV